MDKIGSFPVIHQVRRDLFETAAGIQDRIHLHAGKQTLQVRTYSGIGRRHRIHIRSRDLGRALVFLDEQHPFGILRSTGIDSTRISDHTALVDTGEGIQKVWAEVGMLAEVQSLDTADDLLLDTILIFIIRDDTGASRISLSLKLFLCLEYREIDLGDQCLISPW